MFIDTELTEKLNEKVKEIGNTIETKDENLIQYIATRELISDIIYNIELIKLKIKQKKLSLKYSEEYNIYKTIKEKEERAELETAPDGERIIELSYKLGTLETLKKYYEILMELNNDECNK